eukprot:363634-Chlamydomonas_euryale.AAC.2
MGTGGWGLIGASKYPSLFAWILHAAHGLKLKRNPAELGRWAHLHQMQSGNQTRRPGTVPALLVALGLAAVLVDAHQKMLVGRCYDLLAALHAAMSVWFYVYTFLRAARRATRNTSLWR